MVKVDPVGLSGFGDRLDGNKSLDERCLYEARCFTGGPFISRRVYEVCHHPSFDKSVRKRLTQPQKVISRSRRVEPG